VDARRGPSSCRRKGGAYPAHETCAEQGKPERLRHTVGTPQGEPMGVRVEEFGASEGPAVMAGIRVERATHHSIATAPDAKAGRLPRGPSWRENRANLRTGGGR